MVKRKCTQSPNKSSQTLYDHAGRLPQLASRDVHLTILSRVCDEIMSMWSKTLIYLKFITPWFNGVGKKMGSIV